MPRLRIRKTGTGEQPLPQQALLRMVDHRISQALEAMEKRQQATEQTLHTIAIILRDIRNSAILAGSQNGAISRKLDGFLENMVMAFHNQTILEDNLDDIGEWQAELARLRMSDSEIEGLSDDMVELLSIETDDESPF